MMISRWDPFREMSALQDRINRVFNEQISRGEAEGAEKTWAPVVDIIEGENDLIVRAELPGVSREDMDVEVTSESLTICGERKFDEGSKDKYLRVERAYGPFKRSFSIGVPVQPDKIKAAYRDGVLEITVPKAEEVKPKKIEINKE
ncbi:MAG: Hsp20/alpha crystallin family protein [Armatimonadetes bacterium]|nr:Hsp20/alpha crystallin family protein [Armatimonadota bacterium]